MAQLSILAEQFRKAQAEKFKSRGGNPGFARGVQGSRFFKSRNPEAGIAKEAQTFQSPIFQAFMQEQHPSTPVLNYLRGMR